MNSNKKFGRTTNSPSRKREEMMKMKSILKSPMIFK
jgi:hypothetical protein|tara:strand:+ start:405 stop:512 length:108 start_codon:yes stop_codon:yes gene_type:complete